MMTTWKIVGLCAVVLSFPARGADLVVTMYEVNPEGTGKSIGTISARDSSDYGLLLVPDLKGLSPGKHGFHVHQNAACGPKEKGGKVVPGGAAGGHYDPQGTGRHEGPVGNGHLGDLPELVVNNKGRAEMAMFAPRLEANDLVGRAFIIHASGDNYSDKPKPLGGGGARVGCGTITIDAMDETLEGEG